MVFNVCWSETTVLLSRLCGTVQDLSEEKGTKTGIEYCLMILYLYIYHRDSRQEFEKVGGIFPILHVVFLLDASN